MYLEVSARGRRNEKNVTKTLPNTTGTYSWVSDLAITDAVSIREITYTQVNDTRQFPLEPVDIETLLEYRRATPTVGFVTYYALQGGLGWDATNDKLCIFPNPNPNDSLNFTYTYQPTLLAGDTDVPALPPQFHDVLALGSIAQAMRAVNGPKNDAGTSDRLAGYYDQRYEQRLQKLLSFYNRMQSSQPRRIRPGRPTRRPYHDRSTYVSGDQGGSYGQ